MTKPKAKTAPQRATIEHVQKAAAAVSGALREHIAGEIRRQLAPASNNLDDALERIKRYGRDGQQAEPTLGPSSSDLVARAPSKVSRLLDIGKGLDVLCERLSLLQDRLVAFNDERLGAVPQSPTGSAPSDPAAGHTGELARLVGRAHRLVEAIENEVSRAHEL